MSEANPSPAFAAPGNPDKSMFGGSPSDTGATPKKSQENDDFSMPSAAGDPMGTPICAPYAPTPDEVKRMFRGGD